MSEFDEREALIAEANAIRARFQQTSSPSQRKQLQERYSEIDRLLKQGNSVHTSKPKRKGHVR
jgi:hypothetical protein